jgi:catechol 2,3-dioxygenase-like lactoylglutathione lyase family enzyme
MKIKSVSGVTYYVKDLKKTAKFYETLGFEIRKREAAHITAYSNWFWIDFIAAGMEDRPAYRTLAQQKDRAGAVMLYLGVDDVDGFHKYVRSKGLRPSGVPTDWPSGNREFALTDPDGHHLVFFKRK